MIIERVNQDLENLNLKQPMTTGEVLGVTNIPASNLRYWEKEGYVRSNRGENNYRYFDSYQLIKIMLMKFTQNAVYSLDSIRLKHAIRDLEENDREEGKSIVEQCRQLLNKRNQEQLHGVYYLNRLCLKLGLNEFNQ